MPCEAWSWALKESASWLKLEQELAQERVVVELAVLFQAVAAQDIGIAVCLNGGASFQRTHQAGNKRHPAAGWPT